MTRCEALPRGLAVQVCSSIRSVFVGMNIRFLKVWTEASRRFGSHRARNARGVAPTI